MADLNMCIKECLIQLIKNIDNKYLKLNDIVLAISDKWFVKLMNNSFIAREVKNIL